MNTAPDIALNSSSLQDFYNQYFPYFSTLSTHAKELFITRCQEFISNKDIRGENGFVPANSTKAIVAASAVQLTLGLETWELSYFETIIIHPSDFDHVPTGLKFRGETNLSGVIKLSWKSFIQGYKIPNDKINLGLHEFSHALRLNPIKGHEQDYFIEHYFNKWLYIAYEAFFDIRNNNKSIFRKYGGTNMDEFICVCMEHFFESPQEIKVHYPHLYAATVILLNQQTIDGKTHLHIRKQIFEESVSGLPGFTTVNFKSSWIKSGRFFKLLFILIVAGTALIFDFVYPSLFIFGIFIFRYVHYDLKYVAITLQGIHLRINKGYIFKRRPYDLPASQLISITQIWNDERYFFLYYHAEKEYFYEETMYGQKINPEIFKKELISNKVANPIHA